MIKYICFLIFKISGWKFHNNIPKNIKSFVFIGAPHTSNFDFIPAMTISYLINTPTNFVIKKEWLFFPLNLFFKSIGGIGIERNKNNKSKDHLSYTDAMAKLFSQYNPFILMISPEGTRKPNPHWKSGFYYIAQKAQVPIVLGYADYAKKEAGLGAIIYPTHFESDMKKIANFYQNITGKNPNNFILPKIEH